jgi:hypothetical protein
MTATIAVATIAAATIAAATAANGPHADGSADTVSRLFFPKQRLRYRVLSSKFCSRSSQKSLLKNDVDRCLP